MRTSLLVTALISTLIAACATKGNIPPSKHISQAGPLKIHPDLLTPADVKTPVPAPVPATIENAR